MQQRPYGVPRANQIQEVGFSFNSKMVNEYMSKVATLSAVACLLPFLDPVPVSGSPTYYYVSTAAAEGSDGLARGGQQSTPEGVREVLSTGGVYYDGEGFEEATGGRRVSSGASRREHSPVTHMTPEARFRGSTSKIRRTTAGRLFAFTTLFAVVVSVLWQIATVVWICVAPHVTGRKSAGSAERRSLSQSGESPEYCNKLADASTIPLTKPTEDEEAVAPEGNARWPRRARKNRLLIGALVAGVLVIAIGVTLGAVFGV
ncbi:hypothetical protein CSUI_008824, partial [Cystoisospora suis]